MIKYFFSLQEAKAQRDEARERVNLLRAKQEFELSRARSARRQIVKPGCAVIGKIRDDEQIHYVDGGGKVETGPAGKPELQLAPPTVDIAQESLRTGQALGIIGAQRHGKTHVVQHIARRWMDAGRQVIVCAPRFNPADWCPAIQANSFQTIEQIGNGMRMIMAEAKKREKQVLEQGVDGESLPPVLVILDDWKRQTIELPQLCYQFIADAATMFAGVHIIACFLVHDPTVQGWGLKGDGVSLINAMWRVYVHKDRNTGKRFYGIIDDNAQYLSQRGLEQFQTAGFIASHKAFADSFSRQNYSDPIHHGESKGEFRGEFPGESPKRREKPAKARVINVPRSIPRLDSAPPALIEVQNARGNWVQIDLSEDSRASARRGWEKTGSITKVAKGVDRRVIKALKGNMTTRLAIVRALLNIQHPSWRIVQS